MCLSGLTPSLKEWKYIRYMTSPRYETKAEMALRVLRERILVGTLLPGQKLEINEIAAEFGMSATPVREALKALQADHLAAYTPHRGTIVADNSEEVTAEVFRLRLLLEPAATAAAIHRMTPEMLERLETLHARLVDSHDVSNDVFADRDSEWHWTLYEAAGSAFLSDFIRRLWDSFPWRALVSVSGRRESAVLEHEAMMEAIRSGNPDTVIREMRIHIEQSQYSLRLPPGPVSEELDIAMSAWYGDDSAQADGDGELTDGHA